MASPSQRIFLVDPMVVRITEDWARHQLAGDELGIGYEDAEVIKVGQLDGEHIWFKNKHLTGIKDGTWKGLVTLWIPVKDMPGVKDQHLLCPNTMALYNVPSGDFVGSCADVIPGAAADLEEAFDIRDEKLRKEGSFFQWPENKNRPGVQGAEYDVAFEGSRKQRAQVGKENPGDLVVFLRNHTTGNIEPFMAPQDRVNDMDWNDIAKVHGINKWRGQQFYRKLDQVRYDREESAMWTVHEHQLLSYVVRQVKEFCKSKNIVDEDFMERINWDEVTKVIKDNFEPQPAGQRFVIMECDKPTEEKYHQRRTLRRDREKFERAAEEVAERAKDGAVFEAIMTTKIDEDALWARNYNWSKFLLPGPGPGPGQSAAAKGKTREKVASGRVTKSQPKAKTTATRKTAKGKGKAKADATADDDVEMEEAGSGSDFVAASPSAAPSARQDTPVQTPSRKLPGRAAKGSGSARRS